jgi:hypothetical protein
MIINWILQLVLYLQWYQNLDLTFLNMNFHDWIPICCLMYTFTRQTNKQIRECLVFRELMILPSFPTFQLHRIVDSLNKRKRERGGQKYEWGILTEECQRIVSQRKTKVETFLNGIIWKMLLNCYALCAVNC